MRDGTAFTHLSNSNLLCYFYFYFFFLFFFGCTMWLEIFWNFRWSFPVVVFCRFVYDDEVGKTKGFVQEQDVVARYVRDSRS